MSAKTNDEKPTVVEALAAVMEDVRAVGKDGYHDAPGAKFRFRGVDAVVNAASPALRKHHVIVTPQLVSIDRRDVQTSGGKASRETTVVVKYVWTGPDGSTLDTIVPGEAMDSGDKGTAKAMSVAFRIALLQALCLPTDDADPDSHHYEREMPQQRPNSHQNGHQGNGATRRPSPPPADEPTPEPPADGPNPAAFDVIKTAVSKHGWDKDKVADRYSSQFGEPIEQVKSVPRASAFVKLIEGDPSFAAAPAASGAAQ